MSERRKGFVVRAKTLGRWEATGSRAKVEGLAFGRGGDTGSDARALEDVVVRNEEIGFRLLLFSQRVRGKVIRGRGMIGSLGTDKVWNSHFGR